MNAHTKPPAEPQGALPTDTTPEGLFQAIGRLRKKARDEIHRLILFLDETDNHMELEPNGDEDDASYPEGGARLLGHPGEDDEPTLGAPPSTNQTKWAQGNQDDLEGDGCADDREGDELQHGGDEHDGAEPDEDGEPLLGWTEPRERGQQALGATGTEAEQGSTCPGDLRKGKARYRKRDQSGRQNRDGKHIDAEQGYGNFKRLRNLSDQQKEIVKPRLDRDKVHLS